MSPRVAICIVTHNSARDLPECMAAIGRLDHDSIELIVADCASEDTSLQVVTELSPQGVPLHTVLLEENVGFAGGMNAALELTDAPFILSLNPDARPRSDYITRLLESYASHDKLEIGAVTGRLLRPEQGPTTLLDAAGMHLTLTWRHLDRESGKVDLDQRSDTERVFGATGAASLFSRRALDDIAIDGEIFASEFHSYREDAELCFRLRERRWEVLYEPTAVAVHARVNLPERRRQMSMAVNYHSLKNRYLLRCYHQSLSNFLMTFVPAMARDFAISTYVLLKERSSLAAYRWLWANRRRIFARRHVIQQRRLVPPREINRWFFRRRLPL